MNSNTLLIVLGVALAIGLGVFLLGRNGGESTPAVDTAVQQVEPSDSVAVEGPVVVMEEEEPAIEPTVVLPPLSYVLDGVISEAEYAHSTEVAGVRVYWANDSQALQIGLVSPGQGYVGFGIAPESGMKGANFVLAAVSADGQVMVRDDYGTGAISHVADVDGGGMHDVLAAAGSEADGQTTIEFIIPFDSGDAFDKVLTAGEAYDILVAYQSTADDFALKHTERGSGRIQLDPVP